MRYLGSKRRYIKEIMPILMNHMDSSKTFVDAFGGGMNVVTNMPCKNKVALDINIYIYSLWEMLKMVKLKKQPLYLTIPREFTKEEYLDVKKNYLGEESEYNYPLSLIGYVGSALSFGGAWFNGFANYNPKKNEDHVREAYNGVRKQLDEWIYPESTDFRCCSYDQYDYSNGVNIIYCFDEQTEILTKDGWKYLKDITFNDSFLSRNPENDQLEYLRADYIQHFHYNGYMYQYRSRDIDLMVTPNHKIFCATKNKHTGDLNKHFLKAFDFINSKHEYFITGGGKWIREAPENISIMGEDYNYNSFAYLLGIFFTDGSVNKQGTVTINQSKCNIIQKIKKVFEKLQIKYREYYNTRKCHEFRIVGDIKMFFRPFYLKEKRRVPSLIKDSSIDIIRSFMEGVMDGDGCENRRIYTYNRDLVGDYMELLYKLGFSSSFTERVAKPKFYKQENRYIVGKKPYYVVSVRRKKQIQKFDHNENVVKYNGSVHCVTLEKWHTVLVRRNGKTVWCGQCDPPYQDTKKYISDFDNKKFWDWCREQRKNGNYIYVSEYSAPDDFKEVWRKEKKDTLGSWNRNNGKTLSRIEKIFVPLDQND